MTPAPSRTTCYKCAFFTALTITDPPSRPYCLRYPRPEVRMPEDTACGEFKQKGNGCLLSTFSASDDSPPVFVKPRKKKEQPDAP